MESADEGYMSPVLEEDLTFNYRPLPTLEKNIEDWSSKKIDARRFAPFFSVLPKETQHAIKREDEDRLGLYACENSVPPWDEIASSFPELPGKLSWDTLQVPVPYRFRPEHVDIATRGLDNTSDERETILGSAPEIRDKFVDCIWRFNPTLLASHTINPLLPVRHVHESLEKPEYIEFSTFIQNLVHLAAGRSSKTFKFCSKQQEFKKNPRILVYGLSPTSLWNSSLCALQCGTIVKNFNSYSTIHYDNGVMSQKGVKENSFVLITSLKFVADYAKMFQTILSLNNGKIKTITHLNNFLKPFKEQLETLKCILDACENKSAVDLITYLNYMIFTTSSPHIADVTRSLFMACTSAYLKYVSDWVFRGKLGPKYEFHIHQQRNCLYKDRRFWTKQFLHISEVPGFLKDSVNLIFETGKGLNLLAQLQRENIFDTIPLYEDHGDMLNPIYSFEGVVQLHKEWDLKLKKFYLSQQHTIDNITESIKNLLFGNINISFDEISDVKLATEKKYKEKGKQALFEKQAKQKKIMEDLNQQIKLQKENQLKTLEKLQEEDKRNKEYQRTVEARRANEAQKFRFKYFGDSMLTERHGSSLFNKLYGVQNDENLVDGTIESNPEPQSDLSHSILESQENFQRSEGIGPCGDQATISRPDECDISQTSFLSTDASGEGKLLGVEGKEILEEKLKPENLITRKPPSYSLPDWSSSFWKSQCSTDTNFDTKSVLKFHAFCQTELLSNSISIPLEFQNRVVNTALLHYFIVEKKLFYHLEALNNFLCLQNGLFAYSLCHFLLTEVDSLKTNTQLNPIKLNVILSEALFSGLGNDEENMFTSNLAFSYNKDFDGSSVSSAMDSKYNILDSVKLCYTVGWPLNIILTDDLLYQYGRLFVFQMKLLRAELLLQKAFVNLKDKNYKSNHLFLLHNYRYKLQHFIYTVRNYVNVTVIDASWTELKNNFGKMDSLEKIYEQIVRHIKSVNSNCLLGSKAEGVMKLLSNQLALIEAFCMHINEACLEHPRGSNIPPRVIKKASQNYKAFEKISTIFTQVAYKLVRKGYYPTVAYFLEFYNFNDFFKPDSPPLTEESS